MENVLEVKNLTKQFGNFTAVNNLSFSVGDGEILGLLGPNGAGKTTTIQMLINVMEPTSGSISYFGKSLKTHTEEILKQINFSSTYISMFWLYSTYEILDIFAQLYEVKDRKKRIQKILKEFDIEHLEKKQFFSLSAGQRTIVIMAKAFLNYPRLILLDEPTASLDPEIAVRLREFLKQQRKEYNVSMLFTSHNMAEVEEMCDRILILSNGRVVAEDTPENLVSNIKECKIELVIKEDTKKAQQFLESKNIPFEKNRFRFIIPIDEHAIADLLMEFAKEKIDFQEISINKPDLEDYFLQVIEKGKQV